MARGALVVFIIIFAIAAFVIFPWFTYEAFQRVTDGTDFDFWGWLSALWLTLVLGGTSAAISKS